MKTTLTRITRTIASLARDVLAEMRRLNHLGSASSTRRARVRAVKQALAGSDAGSGAPRRCC